MPLPRQFELSIVRHIRRRSNAAIQPVQAVVEPV